MNITHHNPDTLYKNPAFSQAITIEGPSKMVFVGGQNGIRTDGAMAGEELGAQAEQALKNVLEALKSVEASQANVVKLSIYVVQGQDIRAAFAAAQTVWGMHPTTITVLVVAGLAHPQALVEVEAIAAVKA
jgi:enamine deaminase RidA (YjgF/YER057c/UK114 family)